VTTIVFTISVCSVPVFAEEVSSVDLVVEAGRSLRIALDTRVRIARVGQPISGTLVEPVYAYDRVVIPTGTTVLGHVARLEAPPKRAHLMALLGGNFSPNRHVVLQFDLLGMADGQQLPIETTVGPGIERVSLQVAARPGGAKAKDQGGANAED